MEDIDVLVKDVHTTAAQMDAIMSRVRENCHSFILKAKQEAVNILAEAESKQKPRELNM